MEAAHDPTLGTGLIALDEMVWEPVLFERRGPEDFVEVAPLVLVYCGIDDDEVGDARRSDSDAHGLNLSGFEARVGKGVECSTGDCFSR